jgi:hypothetical protein
MNENERWQMYGLQAIERVNAKRMVWSEFAEAMRVLKLRVDRDVLEHLQQLEKGPDSTFGDSLMELQQNTENHELQCMLNYLFHWRLEDPLESVAETFSSYPPSYMYSVKATGERFRSFEAGHEKAYQELLEKKTFRTVLVVIYCVIKNKYVFYQTCGRYIRCVTSHGLATLGCMHILMYKIFVH